MNIKIGTRTQDKFVCNVKLATLWIMNGFIKVVAENQMIIYVLVVKQTCHGYN